jgi:hypothetical protein
VKLNLIGIGRRIDKLILKIILRRRILCGAFKVFPNLKIRHNLHLFKNNNKSIIEKIP